MKLGQVDLNLLVVLDALLREKNVTRAAETLHLSQPATSTALARLRRVLGDELLYKNGRYLELTPRAEALVEPVREVIAAIEQTIVRPPVFDATSDARRFTVVGSDYVSVTLMRPLVTRLAGLASGLSLDVAPLGGRLLDAVLRDEVDLAVIPDRVVAERGDPGCSHVPVIEDRFVGLVWTEHPRAGDRLDAELVTGSPYLQYAVERGRSVVEQDLDDLGLDRRVAATASGFVTMPLMLAGTDLVAVVPERLARRCEAFGEVRVLEPDFPLSPLRQSAFWHSRRDRDPGHVWLREQLLQVAHEQFPQLARRPQP